MRKATGTITPTREGRWRLRMTIDGARKTIDTYRTRTEAERERAAALAVLTAELPTAGVLAGEWIDQHMGRREASGAYRDADNERDYFTRDVASDPLARIPLKSVKPHDVDEFVDRLRGKGHANGTILKVLGIVRGAFRAAIRKELIKANPAAGVTLPAQRRSQEPWTYATLAEQDAIAAAARAHCAATPRLGSIPIDAMIDFAMGSGLRAGELVTLRLADVHVAEGEEPHITVRYGTAPDLPTKTGRIREVPLFGRALDGLRRWLASMPAWAERNPDKLVFVGARGGYRDEAHVVRWDDWKAILKGAGIDRRFRWHDLRHTCASSLVSGFWGRRWSLEEVMAMLGHTDVKTTQRYAHLAPSAVKAAARETDAKWSPSAKTASFAEPTTEFLRRRSEIRVLPGALHDSRYLGKSPGSTRDQFATVSLALLRAVERGDGETALGLARDLAAPVANLVAGVLGGGPLAITNAIELAGLFLPASVEDAAEVGS